MEICLLFFSTLPLIHIFTAPSWPFFFLYHHPYLFVFCFGSFSSFSHYSKTLRSPPRKRWHCLAFFCMFPSPPPLPFYGYPQRRFLPLFLLSDLFYRFLLFLMIPPAPTSNASSLTQHSIPLASSTFRLFFWLAVVSTFLISFHPIPREIFRLKPTFYKHDCRDGAFPPPSPPPNISSLNRAPLLFFHTFRL